MAASDVTFNAIDDGSGTPADSGLAEGSAAPLPAICPKWSRHTLQSATLTMPLSLPSVPLHFDR